MVRRGLVMVVVMVMAVAGAAAQKGAKKPEDELTRTIRNLDGELFGAYNRCDLEKFGSFFPDELEFYHDRSGLAYRTRAALVESVKENICGKTERTLVRLEVYPLNGFGAVETGVHRFTHPGQGMKDADEGKFVMLWENKGGKWQVTRVISYDHEPLRNR